MSKLPAVRARDVARVAVSLGFVLDRQRGSHAVYYRQADRRRIVIPMHAGTDLKPGTLRGLISDMGLTPEEFAALLGRMLRSPFPFLPKRSEAAQYPSRRLNAFGENQNSSSASPAQIHRTR